MHSHSISLEGRLEFLSSRKGISRCQVEYAAVNRMKRKLRRFALTEEGTLEKDHLKKVRGGIERVGTGENMPVLRVYQGQLRFE